MHVLQHFNLAVQPGEVVAIVSVVFPLFSFSLNAIFCYAL